MSANIANGDSLGEEIDRVCDRFEEEWKSGARPQIERYLVEAPEHARPGLACELLKLDIHYRRERGEHPSPADYKPFLAEHGDLIHGYLAKTAPDAPPALAAPDANGYQLGGIADRYRIEGRLGSGGMGDVYRARQLHP
jgi:hypothetical protein